MPQQTSRYSETGEPDRAFVWAILRASGALGLARRINGRSLLALTYHRVRADGPWMRRPRHPNVVSTSEFDRHVAYLNRHYHVVTGGEFRALVAHGTPLPRRSVLITFDDGYRDNYVEAFPILLRHRAAATFFVTSGFVGSAMNRLWLDRLDAAVRLAGESLCARWLKGRGLSVTAANGQEIRKAVKGLPRSRRYLLVRDLEQTFGVRNDASSSEDEPMTWDQIGEMAEAGMTIGSHSATHQILGVASREEVRDELISSRAAIESRLRRPCWTFSYPNGEATDFTPADLKDVQAAGYECAFTQITGFITTESNPYALPRIAVPGVSDFDVFLSRVTGMHWWMQSARTRVNLS